MSGDWQTVTEAEVDATPDQVWQAIATGPGLNGWFAGTNAVQPGSGGTLRSTMGGYTDELSVTAWEPLQRVTYRSSQSDDGRFYALEWLVEGRAGGTVLRCVASGFLPGDDWEAEFESLRDGGAMYFYTLVQYLTYFRGRTALVVDVLGPPLADWAHAWRVLTDGLGQGVSACQKPPALAGGVVTRAASRAVNWSRFALLGSSTILAAVVANTLVYFIGSALIGYDPEFIVLADVFGPILFTLVPASVAVLLYVALLRFADNPARTFTFISAVV